MAEKRTTIWVMRHGPTTWNKEGRIQGNVETDILEGQIIPYFQKLGVEVIPQPEIILLSALKRARQTAEALISFRQWSEIPLVTDARLNERRWGIFEGMLTSTAREKIFREQAFHKGFPVPNNLEDATKLWDTKGYKVKGGEAIDEVALRVKPALAEIVKKYAGKKILFISHAGVLISLGLNPHVITRFTITVNDGEIVLRDIETVGKK